MTSDGLGEMFEGDFADMCTDKNDAHVDGGDKRRLQACAYGELGSPFFQLPKIL